MEIVSLRTQLLYVMLNYSIREGLILSSQHIPFYSSYIRIDAHIYVPVRCFYLKEDRNTCVLYLYFIFIFTHVYTYRRSISKVFAYKTHPSSSW